MKRMFSIVLIVIGICIALAACSSTTSSITINEQNTITAEEFYQKKTDTISESAAQALKVANLKSSIRECLGLEEKIRQDFIRVTDSEAIYFAETEDNNTEGNTFFKVKFIEKEVLEEYIIDDSESEDENNFKITAFEVNQEAYLQMEKEKSQN